MQAPPVSLSSKPYSFYDFEIGREYRSKIDATIINEEVVFTELSAKYRDIMRFNIDGNGQLVPVGAGGAWIAPSDLQLCIYYRGNKAEINRVFGSHVYESDYRWSGLYGARATGYSVSGTLGEAGRISQLYQENCFGFVGFFRDNSIRLGPSILRLAEDEDGVYVELRNNTNSNYTTQGDANSYWFYAPNPDVQEKFYL